MGKLEEAKEWLFTKPATALTMAEAANCLLSIVEEQTKDIAALEARIALLDDPDLPRRISEAYDGASNIGPMTFAVEYMRNMINATEGSDSAS